MSELERAYRATDYIASLPAGSVILRIGETSPQLDAHLEIQQQATWAFITSDNPRSQLQTAEVNAARLEQLREDLTESGLTIYPGKGVGHDAQWPPENSFLILGISREEALDLGAKWDQNALVYGEKGKPAELLWCLSDTNSP